MPTDPKWRTISKASGQRIGDVMAVYLHMLVTASNATERGRTQSFSCEDVASALDLETADVAAIVDAMQGRVLDGDRVKGWENRQVAREDGAAERSKVWREARKAENQTLPNAAERNRTQTERNQTPDKDTEKIREEEEPIGSSKRKRQVEAPEWLPPQEWKDFVLMRKAMRSVPFTEAAEKGVIAKLAGFKQNGHDIAALLRNAVESGHRTIYEPKAYRVTGPPGLSTAGAATAQSAANLEAKLFGEAHAA
ncbi:hypothetical protein [Methylibium sp.]|uniref:hypothetical protein n=1 Tax=Methylibium sp. TaxID=2067992 RepID=UPI0017E3C949|nr:hypothetical protein [Methylibium sp.]MBA3590356.1 hypothetical protein [Methylibium sp.]